MLVALLRGSSTIRKKVRHGGGGLLVNPRAVTVDSVIVGAGQAGLTAGHHLRRQGFRPIGEHRGDHLGDFVILDTNHDPGGAWQHYWNSLRMADLIGVVDLPGVRRPPAAGTAPSAEVLPAYLATFETINDLQVRRPVTVTAVRRAGDDPKGRLLVESSAGIWATRWVINATGSWTKPHLPRYPGADTFLGRQLHVRDYVGATEFVGRRVVIVGAGVSAIQLLNEVSRVAVTYWVSRREPAWRDGEFDEIRRFAAYKSFSERGRQGLGPVSIVSVTGLHWTSWAIEARDRGVLVRHPMFAAIEPSGVRMPHGELVEADVILWATGFHPAIDHLEPLGIRTPAGGIRVERQRALDEPRLFLVGYTPALPTLWANREGWEVARAIMDDLTGPTRRD